MKLENIMQPVNTYLQVHDTLKDATEYMLETKYNTIPIGDEEGNLLGIFTRSSLYRMILSGASLDSEIAPYIIKDVTITANDITMDQLIHRVQHSKVGETVILDENGKIAGLLTKQSVTRAFAELSNHLRQELNELQSLRNFNQLSTKKDPINGSSTSLYTWQDIITRDSKMEEIIQTLKKISKGSLPVLLRGASGTGKELFAHAIHASSSRSNKPFVTINCAAIPEQLLEAEFFGYEAGAFTGAERKGHAGKFELAHGGTLFLDEIGDMPLNLQSKLLRAIEGKSFYRVGGNQLIQVDVRIISATNAPLEKLIKEKKFREDLLYRLNVMSVTIPPLHERKNDILLLANTFIQQLNDELGTSVAGLAEEAAGLLYAYDWPGNIRELKNIIQRGMALTGQGQITMSSLPDELKENNMKRTIEPSNEKKELEEALIETNGNKAKATRLLGISRSTFYEKMNKYGII
ncbi:sigma-54-dependent Fis family transcriptional regulator [Pueribacillus theae]|uniref:Sigma-54-dependent Fis family transcriptional regulator n=1 Tax=Pueribacillus theae TaxID=2171751 RepID=A0A2U1JVF9_9BACI|nr:sigma 54-interacting transcriptional regulator [Pueribacillus theae]PWA09200.1 sigma-54-dependent Fis family transcriptional regulator [Pueribacillus theae]